MKPLSTVADAIPRSGIREVMAAAGKYTDVINVSVGEPSFNTPPHIIEGAFEAAAAGQTKYTSNYGTPALREAIAKTYSKQWGVPVKMENVLASTGGVNAIMATTLAIMEAGDEALVPDPAWPNYISILGICHGKPVRYRQPVENGYLPDSAEVEKLITPKTKLLFLCNPSNPTGAVFPAATVEAMVALARKHDLYVISDEIYEHLVFDGEMVPAAKYDTDGRVITISGFSKTYAMTGWRLGYAIGNADVITLAGKMMEPMTSCPTAISQAAGIIALESSQDCVAEMRVAYRRRRDIARDILQPAGLLPVVPNGAFYALVDLSRCGIESRALAFQILDEEHVAAAPGDTFGEVLAHGFVRISLASSDEDVAEACRRLVRFAQRHSK